jgi:hypothetical protein
MKARSDTERILDAYLAPEADRLADRVIDAALADIARTPQRRALRVPWRFPLMPALSRATGVAVVALVAVVGVGSLFYLNSRPDGDGSQGTPVPSATPAPAPTVAPSAAVIPPLSDGALAAGTYRLRPFASETMTIDATVPDGGWLGGLPGAIGGPVGESNGPNGVFVAFLRATTINSDPCHWDHDGSGSAPQAGDIEVGPTVDDLAEALAASASYESTTPVEATLGGYSGKRLELQLVPDPSGCDNFSSEENQYFVFGGRDGGQFAQGGANTWQVTIVDVEGTRLIAVLVAYEETSAAHRSAAQSILESVVITP